jgi:hypothetical protein
VGAKLVGLTPLEAAVLQEVCNQLGSADSVALKTQIHDVSVSNRKNTGAGFYTYFSTAKDAAPPITADRRQRYVQCEVGAKINGIENAPGFILWLKDGYIDYLEGYTMAFETTSEIDLVGVDFERGLRS